MIETCYFVAASLIGALDLSSSELNISSVGPKMTEISFAGCNECLQF